jgi:hypothetical protein
MCEDVRMEMGGKSSILGVFGLLPGLMIRILTFDRPVARMVFFMMADECEADEEVTLTGKITDDHGTDLVVIPFPEQMRLQRGKRPHFAIGAANVLFPREGRYRFVLVVNERTHFEASFVIEQGSAEDFR